MSDCSGRADRATSPKDSGLSLSKNSDSVNSQKAGVNDTHDSAVVDNIDSSYDVYRFQNDTLIQLAYIHYFNPKRILFRLATTNKITSQTYSLTDTAENTANNGIPNPATYNDELDGDVMYPVYEFERKMKHWNVTIGIEPSRGKRLSIQTHPDTLGGSFTPAHSVGTLRLLRLSTAAQQGPHLPG